MSANADEQAESSENLARAMPPALRRRLQQCFEHGTRLMGQTPYDFNYAHSLLVECVVNDPGNHVYQDAFLTNLQRKYGDNKRGALLKFGSRGSFKKAVLAKNWPTVLRLGPEILKSNPWDAGTLRGLAEACAAHGFFEAELRFLRNALEAKPQDPAINRHCALSLARIGRFDDAIVCWQRVDEAKKGNREAQEMIAELQVAKSHKRSTHKPSSGGREGQSTTAESETARADPPQTTTEAAQRETGEATSTSGIPLTPRQQLEQALVQNPTNTEAYVELAELHVANGRLGEAAHLLTKGLAATGQNLTMQEHLEDVEILRKQEQLEIAEQRAAASSGEDRRQLAEQLRDDLNRYQLAVFDRRSQRYPEDLELKYQVGVRLKQCGNFRQAVKTLTEALPLAERQASATFEIAECLQRLKKYDVAIERYKEAGELASDSGQTEIRQLSLYRTGLLSAGLGNQRAAEDAFSALLQLEPGYKDVASRLDKIREMRHKG